MLNTHMSQKGISPIIATVLLVLVSVILAATYFGWLHSFVGESITKGEEIGRKRINCSNAGITIISCTYDKGRSELVSVKIENTGSVDLNGFKVIAKYADNSSDSNKNSNLYIDVGATGIAYLTANHEKTVSEIKIIPLQCDTISDTTSSCS
ncbi:MAG: hypothetical protein N3F05_00690 [Candidatus Diapherotrites archaeon]|nr:hypothetical protein [Candidatus Diapherotrites archaeon]